MVDGVVPAVVDAASVAGGGDDGAHGGVRGVGEMVAEVLTLQVELLRVKGTRLTRQRRAVRTARGGAQGGVLRAPMEERAEAREAPAGTPFRPPRDEVKIVRALVDEHARPLRLHGPVAAAEGVGRLAVGDGDQVPDAGEVPDDAGGDDLPELLVERGVAQDVPREDETSRRALGVADLLALGPRAADRLFEKDVIPLLERRERRGEMELVRKRDNDGVGLDVGGKRLLPGAPDGTGRGRGPRVGPRQERLDGVGEARQGEILGMGVRVRRVGAAADAEPQDDRPDGFHLQDRRYAE